uniref:Kazal-like domain-containing protein n=1 Tax=Plectus sambesii TaxID=2011161 RepID=A0A914WHI2_9BILA
MLPECDMRPRAILLFAALFASTLTEQQAVQAKRTSACSCPRLFKPVCGTDSQTYNSDCKLKCAQETNPGLRMAYEGICCPQPFCPGHWDPLCDDHGHTHENECMFRYALCVMRKTDNLVLEIASRGECKAGSCDTECPKLTDPVCDTSGRTHENMCWFDNTNCLRRQSGDRSDRPLLIAYKGECVKTSHRPTTTSHFITSIAPTSLPPSPAFAISRRPIGGGDGRADSGAPEPEPPVAVPEPEVNPSLPEQAIGLPEPEPTVNSSSEHLTAVGGVPEPEPPLDAAIPGLNIGTQESHLPVGSSNPLSASPSPVPEPDAEDKLIQPEPTAEPGLNNRSINAASEGSAPEPEPSVAPSSEPEPEFTTGGAPEPEPSVPASSESEPEFTTGGASEPEPSVASSPEPEPKFTTGGAPEPEPSVASSPEPEPEPTTGGAPEPERSVSASSELEPESTTGGAPEPEPSVSASPEPEPEPITGLTPEPELPVSSPESKPTPGSAPFAHAQPTFNAAHPKPTELLPTGAVLSKEILSGPHVALTNSTPVNSLDSSSLPEPEPSRVPEQNETAALWTTEAVDISPHATNDSHDPTLHPFDSDASTNSKEQAMLANCSISTCSSLDGPVCDSAGQTHINKCAFESLNCLDRRRGGVIEETRIVHEGPCELEQEQQAQDEEQVDAPVIQASIDEKLPLLAEGETGHSKPIICSAAACTKEWNPVCDSNGKTHRNRCLFEFSACKLAIKVDGQSDIALAYDGECVTQAPNHDELIFNGCPLCHPQEQVNAVPVCDNTNQTYPSLCIFNAHNCRQKRQNGSGAQRVLVHFGECRSTSPIFALEQEQCPQGCSNEYKPLCDNRATTHPNLCAFQSVNCQLRKRGQDAPYVVGLGECVQPSNAQLPHQSPLPLPRQQITPFPQRAFAPIRANKTEIPFPRRQLTATQFECPEPRCENERRPVCDSDGNVHRNPCLFAWARCLAAQQGKELTLAREGPCSGSCKTERACSNTSEPVCGSDLITYPNICFFRQAQCENKELELLFNGECGLCLKEACPQLGPDADDTLFVCDTNGDTKSRCEFKMVQCIYERKSGQNISELHSGRCCDDADLCPATPDPVCDSRGLTIRNRCVFEVERCKIEKMDGGSLALVKEQPCEMTQPSPAAPSDLSSAALGVGNVPESAALPVIATSLDCKAPCVDDYKPVCGNDGKTYANQCKLSAAMCLSGQLKMAYDGECCDIQCPTQWSPVCDANGVTHENICEFGKARCTAQRTKKQELKIASYGICQQSSCDQPCSTAYEPLCGSNGHFLSAIAN